jgi:hypothetical protein
MNQKQHIIPKVYLKQFGYRDKGGIWKVPTFNIEEISLMNKIDKTLVKQSNIKSLLREENIYDIPISKESKRQLEEFFNLTENYYPKVIEEIKNEGELSANKKDMLLGFISLLFVRTRDYRMILNHVIENKDYPYLNGILEGNQKRIETVLNLPRKSAVNFLTAFSGIYVYKCLQNFRVSIIKTIPEEKWATTDNPVFTLGKADKNKRIDFMGIDTKMLCPLSPDFLAYVDHKDSSTQIYRSLEEIKENKVNEIDKETFMKIWHQLTDMSRITKYLIIPTERKKI